MEQKEKSFISKYKIDILLITAIALIAFILSNNYAILFVQGESMYPTYNHKDVIILKQESELTNGDIAVFNSPESWSTTSKKFIKRIIASEGDVLTINNEELMVNEEVVAEISAKKCGLHDTVKINVGDNKYFVVGDNYSSSNDSLTQFCNRNDNFLVDEEQFLLSGKELKVIGGF